jgi:hypothetical protein
MPPPVPNLKTYDLSELILNFGLDDVKGFGPNDALQITTRQIFDHEYGLHGVIVPKLSKHYDADASLTIMRESDNAQSLSIVAALDQLSGLGNFPFIATYLDGPSVFTSIQSRITKKPDPVFNRKNGYLTWIFKLYRLIDFG